MAPNEGGSGAAVVRAFCTLRNGLAVSGTGPGWCGAQIWRHAAARASSRRRLRGSGSAAGQRVAVRFTSSAAATVTAVTTETEGHAPMRLARDASRPSRPRTQRSGWPRPPARMRGTSLARTRRQPRRTARRPGHGGPSAVRRETPRRGRGRRPQTTGTWDCRLWALRYLLVPAGQYHLEPARLLTRAHDRPLRSAVAPPSGHVAGAPLPAQAPGTVTRRRQMVSSSGTTPP